jgi:hypothetical protein
MLYTSKVESCSDLRTLRAMVLAQQRAMASMNRLITDLKADLERAQHSERNLQLVIDQLKRKNAELRSQGQLS